MHLLYKYVVVGMWLLPQELVAGKRQSVLLMVVQTQNISLDSNRHDPLLSLFGDSNRDHFVASAGVTTAPRLRKEIERLCVSLCVCTLL